MRKVLSIIGALVVICFLINGFTLKKKSSTAPVEKKIKILSTTAMIGDIVGEVGGERVSLTLLIHGAIDPHSYELVKGDDEKIDAADIVFFNGLNLEHGASLQYKLLNHSDAISVGDYLLAKYPEDILFEEGQLDPHIWMDISLWAKIVDPIVEALSLKDPEGAVYYQQRGTLLQEKMLNSHVFLKESMKKIPEKRRYLVTSHDAFGYFARGYLASEEDLEAGDWKKRFAAPEGLAPDGQLGVIDLQKIIDYLATYEVGVVFPESNVSRDSLRKIIFACKEKKLPIRFSSHPLYGDSMGEATSYLEMIQHNGKVLMKEWESLP